MIQNRMRILYNKPTKFQIFNCEVETKSLTITTPECIFDNDENTCRNYVKIFLSLDCKFHQANNNHTFYLYLSPLYYNNYDSRFIANNGINISWVFLPYSLSCQTNNVCLFIVNFVLSYKDWSKVPINGNNVTLDCNEFTVFSYV